MPELHQETFLRQIAFLIVTNLAIMLTLGLTTSLLGLNQYASGQGLNLTALLGFCAVLGFGGAFLSLLISKPIAKWSLKVQVLNGSESDTARWLTETVKRLSEKAGIGMPEVGVYEGEPNAFATGARRNAALVAVSTGLLKSMEREQVEAVLAHEIGHIQNGDMVTLTLVQGVVNTFVLVLARLVGFFVDRFLLRNEEDAPGVGFTVTVFVMDILLGFLAAIVVAYVSRQREFRADEQATRLMGEPHSMVSALRKLQSLSPSSIPAAGLSAAGISGQATGWKHKFGTLFASHPPLEERIAAIRPPVEPMFKNTF